MNTDTKRLLGVAATCALLAVTLSPALIAKEKEHPIEAYSGHWINPNPGSVRNASFLDIEIFRLSTDEERKHWVELLAEKGSDKMISDMRDEKSRVGTIRLPGTVAYNVKYARAFDTPEGRQIVLATDRPLALGELSMNSRTLDYGLTLIEFTMPPDGKAGEGNIVVGAQLEIDKDGKLIIENASFQPLRFGDVKQKKVKKK